MALRLRRDVQKASYYVWFLGAEEAKGLRGSRVIHSVLPYLIDRSRGQEPLKVTLQVSHKGIKILQGSSKHFIPHSAITSSVQTDDIVACVLLLYNPATKCPLHVHAYRCDSESTAEALNQQLQTLINRPENQKRFEELENRLGILPPMSMSSSHKSSAAATSSSAASSHNKLENSQKQQQSHHQSQQQHRRLESSPKRFSSSLGSDTGNSTRESECSEEHSGSPVSRSPPMPKPLQQNNELFDSLAAELRAKLNGNGPPILLPPRDYDTVHRSKGNLTAIELRRCRNKLIVGSTKSAAAAAAVTSVGAVTNGLGGGVKQVSSRGSSGIGSDLAPSPERQELNSSSDDDRWSNENDNSVIALKPSQIPLERPAPTIIPHHPLLNRKSAMQPPEDSYLRDLPAKPYTPHASGVSGRHISSTNNVAANKVSHHSRDKQPITTTATNSGQRSKTPSSTPSWTREDEIKPIIMRPADYDAKFNRVLQAEQKQEYHRSAERDRDAKPHDTDKYNEINRLMNKKHSRDRESPERRESRYVRKVAELDDDSEPSNEHLPLHATPSSSYRKENLTDKQKFIEYTSQKQTKPYAKEEPQRYGGRHRYVDPSELPFEQAPTVHKKYPAASPDRSDLGRSGTTERQRERQRMAVEETKPRSQSGRDRERDRERFSRSSDRNPYREPESIPYIESMEKMMKSTALHYTAYDGTAEPKTILKDDHPSVGSHTKVSGQRSKSYPKHDDDRREDFGYTRSGRSDYAASANGSNISPKERFNDAKNKFHAMERSGSRYDLTDEKDGGSDYKPRRRGSIEPTETARIYDDWSDEERRDDSPPPPLPAHRSSSRSRDHWEQSTPVVPIRERERELLSSRDRDALRERESRDLRNTREVHEHRDYSRDVRARELPGMRPEPKEIREHREIREPARDNYRENRYDPRELPHRALEREAVRDLPRERQRSERTRDLSHDYTRENRDKRRDYTPEARAATGEHHRSDYPERPLDKQRSNAHSSDKYPPPPTSGAPIPNGKNVGNLRDQPKGYRHSYAEPVFARSGGRVGLAAVNPF